MAGRAPSIRLSAAAVLLAGAVLAGQMAADGLMPLRARADTGRLVGRTGFAFVTGVRTFAAAVLWSRLDPIDDRYYAGTGLGQKQYLLPSIRIVTWLDPQFEEPYYAGPFILYDAGQRTEAVRLAEEGVRANPQSGFLHGSLAQILMMEGRLAEARREEDIAIGLPWASEGDRYNLLASAEIIFRKTGAPEKAAWAAAERARLKEKFVREGAIVPKTGD